MIKFYRSLFLFLACIFSIHYVNAQNTVVTPATAINNICVGGGYVTIGNIVIAETNFANFNAGATQAYIISAPANFEFNIGVTPTVTEIGNGITNIVASAPTATTFTFTYDVSGASTGVGPLDQLTIAGLQVRAITAPSTGSVARSGGTAVQAGNAPADGQNHCTLTSINSVAITTHPLTHSACLGANTSFTVASTGGTGYQWQLSTAGGGGPFANLANGAPYSNVTTATLNITAATALMNGYVYRCTVINAPCGNVNSNNATITVTAGAASTFFGLQITYCANEAVDTLESFPVGGTFSGPGIGATSLVTGKAPFNPGVGGLGARTITYTFGCTNVNKNTTVYAASPINITSPPLSSYVTTDAPIDLIAQSGGLTVAATFTGPGVSSTKFYPNIAGVSGGTPHRVTASFTNANGCTTTTFKDITVTSPSSGTGIPCLDLPNKFCTNSAFIVLTKDSILIPPPYAPGPTYNAGDYEFAGYTGSGIIFNSGTNKYEFHPDLVVGGSTITVNYLVRQYYYTFYFDISCFCFQFVLTSFTYVHASQQLTVEGAPGADFALLGSVCKTTAPFDMATGSVPLMSSGAAGTGFTLISTSPVGQPNPLSGTGNANFNPNVITQTTTYTIKYLYKSSNACKDSITKSITVYQKPALPTLYASGGFWGAQNETFCYASPKKYIGAIYSASTVYNWYNNVALTPPTISDYYYIPPQSGDNAPGTYNYYVTQTVLGCTSDPLAITITINDGAVVTAGIDQTICQGNTSTLTGTSNRVVASGTSVPATWSSPTAGGFSPSATNLGAVYTPTAADIVNQYVDLTLTSNDPDGAGPCPVATDVVRVNVNPGASANAGSDVTYCSNGSILLQGSYSGSANSVTWSGGAGTISLPSSPVTLYTATNGEKSGGGITFTLTTNDPDGPGLAGPCLAAIDNVVITLNPEARVEAGPDQAVCRSGSTVINTTGASRSGGSNSATWSGGSGVFGAYTSTNTNLSTTYTPTAAELPANGGINNFFQLYLTSDDPDGAGPTGPCLAVVDSMLATINPVPNVVRVIVPDTAFCKSESLFQLNDLTISYYPQQSGSYTDLPGTNTGISGVYFVPAIATVGPHTIRYTYNDINGCSNFKDTLINVYGVPNVVFDIQNFCAEDSTLFDGTGSTLADPYSNITSYYWDFGDGTTTTLDTITAPTPFYKYKATLDPAAIQTFNVELRVRTNKGCFEDDDSTITVGNIPPANFKWSQICPADTATSFIDISSFPSAEVSQYFWDFDDGNVLSGPGMIGINPNNLVKNPWHKMANATGAYDVAFTISSIRGCDSSVTKRVNILDEYMPTAIDPYATNFANNNAFWATDGQNSSWQWGSASKNSINTGSRKVWVTDTLGTYNVNEKSFLNGPCLNFDTLTRPMISLKIWSANQQQIAGAVLQSSVNGGATWQVVGALGSGVNWYDNFGILGNPGNQPINQFGWTGQYPGWKIAKLSLNNLADSTSVRLRIAFGSGLDSLNLTDGFAIDSIWVGDRDKLLLVENFTNTSSTSSATADANLNTIVNNRPNDVVAIHYHTGFPGTDQMNLRNQANPSSRVLHYGVPQVPYKVFDGNYDFGTTFDDADIDRRSLDAAKFAIKLNTTINSDSVIARVKIIAKDTVANDFVVHVAVIERNAILGPNTYQWVLTRMLPNAAGTFFSQTFNKGDSAYLQQEWDYLPGEVYDPAQLGVIVFIQDIVTKEVYQAAYQLGTGGVATGLKNQLLAGKELFIYPNPANNTAQIVFEESSQEEYNYLVYDELGKVLAEGIVAEGSNGLTLNTSRFASGLYVIRIGNSKEGYAYKKLVVTH